MAKLNFKKENSKFELEVGDDLYVGILNDLTPKQKAAQDKILDPLKKENENIQKILDKIGRLETKLVVKTRRKLWKDVDEIQDKIFKLQDEIKTKRSNLDKTTDLETLHKDRIKTSIESDDLDKILEAGEKHGYQNVYDTILQDIIERNVKKPKAS